MILRLRPPKRCCTFWDPESEHAPAADVWERCGGDAVVQLSERCNHCLHYRRHDLFGRGHAGGHYGGAQFALRQINAQRSCVVSVSNGVVYGEVDLDAKMKSSQQRGRPMWTPERDSRGRNAWLAAIAAMLTAPPSVVGEHFFVRATNSSDGNPFRATEWRDGPETAARSRISLCSILQMGKFGVPAAIARSLTGHTAKSTYSPM